MISYEKNPKQQNPKLKNEVLILESYHLENKI